MSQDQTKFPSIYHMRHFMHKQTDELWKKLAAHCSIESYDCCKLPESCNEIVLEHSKCKNVSKEQFQTKLKECDEDENKMMILHMNLGGLITDKEKITDQLNELKGKEEYFPDIICISEYNNKEAKITEGHYELKNYKLSTKGSSGGVAIFVKKETKKFKNPEEYNFPKEKQLEPCDTKNSCESCSKKVNYECTWVKLEKMEKTIFIGAIYIHPKSFKNQNMLKCFTEKLQQNLKDILDGKPNNYVYLVGDFNLNWLDPPKGTQDFLNLLISFNIKLLITEPTHTTFNKNLCRTLIDHIYTNEEPDKSETGVVLEIESIHSFHHPIYCIN